METIGMIAAMSLESKALLRFIGKWERTAIGTFRGYHFRLSDRDCFLVESGVGIRRARDAARALLKATSPQFLVSFGVAGAVKNDLNIGDVVIASQSCLLDKGNPVQFQRLADLSAAAWQAASQAMGSRKARLFSGTAITTRGSQVVQLQPETMAFPVLEMETAGIARVAAERGIPLVSLRAVSDRPQAPIPFDLELVTDEESNLQISKIIGMVLHHPDIILHYTQLMRNVRSAAENAATSLVAALSQPSPVIQQTL